MAAPRTRPETTPKDRLRQFFVFCDGLEVHPFFAAHEKGTTFRLDFSVSEDGPDVVRVNFDETHLESLLGRLRQFFSDRELFSVKEIRRAICDLFGDDPDFRSFYDKLIASLNRPFPERSIQAFKANEKDVVAGFSFVQLVEAQLYTGPLHSERILHAEPGSAEEGLAGAHELAKKQLVLDLAYGALRCVENILALRNWGLRRARAAGQVELFPELQAFDARTRTAESAE